MRPEVSPPPNCTVAVVGGGTAGLALAAALARSLPHTAIIGEVEAGEPVVVLEP